jgi:hypothetical protein
MAARRAMLVRHQSPIERTELTLHHGRARVPLGHRVNGHRSTLSHPAHRTPELEIVLEPPDSEGGCDIVQEWGLQSFPASDPPANW